MRILIALACITLTQAFTVELTCQDIRAFVNAHNKVRQRFAWQTDEEETVKPAHMTCVIWDDELARKAEGWAMRSGEEHNPDITIDSHRFLVGENMYINHDYREDWLNIKHIVNEWADEKKLYKYKRYSPEDVHTSNYTQLIWEKTHYVGCGVTRKVVAFKTILIAVCYYGPKGNIPGKYPYKMALEGKMNKQLFCGLPDCSRKYGQC